MADHVARYSTWVRAHAEDARRLEDLVRLASMLAPGLGGGARSLLGEVLYALTNVLSLTHDMILDDSRATTTDSSLRMVLSVLASIDIVVEVTSWRVGGRRSRHHAVFLVETVRAVLKTLVLARGSERFLVRGGQFLPGAAARPLTATASPAPVDAPPEGWWRGGLTGIALPLPTAYSAGASLASSASQLQSSMGAGLWDALHTAASACTSEGSCSRDGTPASFARATGPLTASGGASAPRGADCSARSRPLRLLGELLYIWRPVLFAALRLALGGRSWLPLLASAAVDASSARLTAMACDVAAGLPPDAFIPQYTLAALQNSGAQLAAAWRSFVVPGQLPPPESDALTDLPGSSPAGAAGPVSEGALSAAFVTPPGGSPEGVLIKALGAPRAGLAGVAIRAALWMFSSPPGLSAAEDAELQRRRTLWAFYLLRSPLFYSVTKPAADGAVTVASYVPLLGSLAAYGASVLQYIQEHQMYTAASQG